MCAIVVVALGEVTVRGAARAFVPIAPPLFHQLVKTARVELVFPRVGFPLVPDGALDCCIQKGVDLAIVLLGGEPH
jgi:hypothetical protein